MRVILFVNGIINEYGWLRSLVQNDDYLICADGGTYHCLACGHTPDEVVGDMDSVDPETVVQLAEAGVRLDRHPTAKNETDLELAVDAALSYAASDADVSEILLVGVLGGRLDQMLANLLILVQREWPVPLRIVDQSESAQVVRSGQTVHFSGRVGDVVSAIPLSPTVTGISYTGLLYPLHNFTMTMGSTRGISNELAQEEATVSVEHGDLLVIQQHFYSPELASSA